MTLNSIQTRTYKQMAALDHTYPHAVSSPSTTSAIHASVNHALAWFGLGIAGMSCGGDFTPPTHY
jgi:hypothetical protein